MRPPDQPTPRKSCLCERHLLYHVREHHKVCRRSATDHISEPSRLRVRHSLSAHGAEVCRALTSLRLGKLWARTIWLVNELFEQSLSNAGRLKFAFSKTTLRQSKLFTSFVNSKRMAELCQWLRPASTTNVQSDQAWRRRMASREAPPALAVAAVTERHYLRTSLQPGRPK